MTEHLKDSGKKKSRAYVSLLIASALLLLAFIASSISEGGRYSEKDARRFESVLQEKEGRLLKEFATLDSLFRDDDPLEVLRERSAAFQQLAMEEELSIYYFRDSTLLYWSDHSVPIPSRWESRLERNFHTLRNGDYVSLMHPTGQGVLLGLVRVRTHYPIENDYLVNSFQKDFHLGADVRIEFFEARGLESVFSRSGDYLFSLNFEGSRPERAWLRISSLLCLLLALAFYFAASLRLIHSARGRQQVFLLALFLLLNVLAALLITRFSFPEVLTSSVLFRPELYASRFFESLGDLLVISLAVLLSAILLYASGVSRGAHRSPRRKLWMHLLYILAPLILAATSMLIKSLVLDSSISFEIFRVTTISLETGIGLLVIIIWLLVMILCIDGAIRLGGYDIRSLLLGGALPGLLIYGAVLLLAPDLVGWLSALAYQLFLFTVSLVRRGQKGLMPFSRYVLIILVMALLMTIGLQRAAMDKREQLREVELVKLASEHDAIAEMLFGETSMAIRNDSVFAQYFHSEFVDIDRVVNRLRRLYFSGYWNRYDIQVTVCRPEDRVYLEPPEDVWLPCYGFFEEIVQDIGMRIEGSDFYFMDYLDGRISYLANIPYYHAGQAHRVYIELNSRVFSEELGYPELLLDREFKKSHRQELSYAKYSKGELFSRQGDFSYRLTPAHYTSGEKEFEEIILGGYDHSVYNIDDTNTIVVGQPSVRAIDHLISFSYVFAYTFLLLALLYLTLSVSEGGLGFEWSFKNRIRYSLVSIMFLTFMLICAGTVYFIVEQYRDKHNDNVRNLMRSVYIELVHKVEFEDHLRGWSSDKYYNLDELLVKFSNVFFTDINLYDPEGRLLATSREEIFNRQLLSKRMNREVYEHLSEGDAAEFIHDERIGDQRYISAYVPLLNNEGELLAYLNLPYFTRSEVLTRDVTNLVVAVINVYLVLLLSVLLLSMILADRITQPLRLLRDRMAHISLGRRNELLEYGRRDEIRGLVEEYNFMVQELERSAALLARSERESAWREMAKQIAHEIKNPLTPMKLNVQHLQRTLSEGECDKELAARVSSTLIEQIDSLSAIANEFSDFAKMPQANAEKVNLVEKLEKLMQLFESTAQVRINLDLRDNLEAWVSADKEQLMRVFINLVKNAMQAIPEGREGEIRISLYSHEKDVYRVSVRDNGKGVPDEIREKLFRPNFTTKSSGMGMGLAISHSIITSFGGRLWYDTVLHQGSTFWVELPRYVDKSS